MAWDCTEPSKEESVKSNQAGEDAQIQINLSEEYTYRDVEVFELFSLGVKEKINKPETIDADITGIERRILGGIDEHSFLNKGNETQVSGKVVRLWWMMLDIQSTVNVVINKELEKDIRDARGRFARFHCNAGTRIVSIEANPPPLGSEPTGLTTGASQKYFRYQNQKISTFSCMISRRATNSSWLLPTGRSCSTIDAIDSTVMIWKKYCDLVLVNILEEN